MTIWRRGAGRGWTRMMFYIAQGRCGERQAYDVRVEMEAVVGVVVGGGHPRERGTCPT